MMGAMASKKARPSSPSSRRMASDRASEVSGPVAMIAGPSGMRVVSSRSTSMPGCSVDGPGHGLREEVTVHRQGRARRHAAPIRRLQQHRAQQAHLAFELAMSVGGVFGLEGVRAHQLAQTVGLVRRRAADGPHLDQTDPVPTTGQSEGRLAAGESTPHHNGVGSGTHERRLRLRERPFPPRAALRASRSTAASRSTSSGSMRLGSVAFRLPSVT